MVYEQGRNGLRERAASALERGPGLTDLEPIEEALERELVPSRPECQPPGRPADSP
jgi:hypothetical protein